jgi:hypothetical protein
VGAVSDLADDKADEVLGMNPEVIALLKEEYFHLHKTVEDFDQRTLTIKAWSVTTSMIGIAASFLHNDARVLSLLAALASLSFWMTEALWKEFQQCYYPRIRELEHAFATGNTAERPFRINQTWSQTYHSYDLKRFVRSSLWPHIMFPQVFIVVVGTGIWIVLLLQKS